MNRALSRPRSRPPPGGALLSLVCVAACARAASLPPPIALPAHKPIPFAVDSRHPQVFSLRLRKDQYVRIRVEQLRHLALVDLQRPGQSAREVRFRDTGRHGIIRISLAAQVSGSYRLVIRPYEPRQSASGIVTASVPRAATAADREDAAAEVLYAHAEWSRHKGSASSWPRALKDYQAAAALALRLDDATLERAALTGESRLDLFRLSRYRAAGPLAREAVALPFRADVPGEVLAWKTLATADYFMGRYRQAIRATRRALELNRRTGDRYWRGILLGNLAYLYREVGRTDLALATARRSLAIARSIHDWFGVDFNLEALGDFHLARGQLDQAFLDYRRALAALRKQHYPLEAGAVWKGLGELFEVAHEPGEAQSALRKALAYDGRAHDAAGALEVVADLGRVSLRQGEARMAMREYRQGLGRAKALSLPRDESLMLTGLAGALAATGRDGRALSTYRSAIALATRISATSSEAAAWQGLGDCQAAVGSLTGARAAYRRAFRLWSRQADRVRMATALASLARLDYRGGRLRRAHERIKRALELIETSRESLTSRQLRTSYFASQHAYYALGVSILMALDRRFPRAGYAVRALEMAERARARTLLDALDQADRFPAGLIPSHLAGQLRRNRAQVDAAHARWRELVQDPRADNSRFAALHNRIESLLRSGDALEALARARSQRYATLTGAHPVAIARVQRLLARGEALIEYWVGEPRSYAWLIRRGAISTFTLPGERALARQVRRLRRAATARTLSMTGESLPGRIARVHAADARTVRLAAGLGGRILPACRSLRQVRILYVVPDGPLFGVPFPILRARDCADSLVERSAVIEEPSASVLLSLASRSAAGASPEGAPSVAVFADPVYSRDDPRFGAWLKRAGTPAPRAAAMRFAPEDDVAHLPRLKGSRHEALAIERLSGPAHAVVTMGFAATAKAVRTVRWRRFQVVDFAVHTLLNPDHPEFSGLVFSMYRRDGTPRDGVLWMRDIYGLRIPVDLVVLSGCRTLGGHQVPGVGLVGLSRAFLMAGAHAVLGSLWSVEDEPTGRFMTLFYREMLRRHLGPAQALRAVQLSFIASSRYSAPYYWAGFSIEGRGEPLR